MFCRLAQATSFETALFFLWSSDQSFKQRHRFPTQSAVITCQSLAWPHFFFKAANVIYCKNSPENKLGMYFVGGELHERICSLPSGARWLGFTVEEVTRKFFFFFIYKVKPTLLRFLKLWQIKYCLAIFVFSYISLIIPCPLFSATHCAPLIFLFKCAIAFADPTTSHGVTFMRKAECMDIRAQAVGEHVKHTGS